MGKTRNLAALRAAMRASAFGLLALVAACGGDDGPPAEANVNADYYPLQVGERKVYRLAQTLGDYGQETTFPTRTITGTRDIDGKTYSVEHTAADGESDMLFSASATAIRSSENGGTRWWDLVRFPYTVDAPVVQEQGPFDERDADGDGQPEALTTRWTTTVKGLVTVETPAGSFAKVLHVHTDIVWSSVRSKTGTTNVSTATRDTWLAPGVGPVRTEWKTDYDYVELWELADRQTPDQAPRDRTAPTLQGVTFPTHFSAPLVLTFDEPVTASVLAAVSVTDSTGKPVRLSRVAPWDPDGRKVAMSPYTWSRVNYTLHIAAGISDLAGNTMAAQADRAFTVDGSQFTAYYASPLSQTVNVPSYNRTLTTFFTAMVDPDTVAAVTLREGNTPVAATVSLTSEYELSVEPAAPLKPATRYTIDLTGLKDVDGNAIVNPLDWTFTTGATVTVRP